MLNIKKKITSIYCTSRNFVDYDAHWTGSRKLKANTETNKVDQSIMTLTMDVNFLSSSVIGGRNLNNH